MGSLYSVKLSHLRTMNDKAIKRNHNRTLHIDDWIEGELKPLCFLVGIPLDEQTKVLIRPWMFHNPNAVRCELIALPGDNKGNAFLDIPLSETRHFEEAK